MSGISPEFQRAIPFGTPDLLFEVLRRTQIMPQFWSRLICHYRSPTPSPAITKCRDFIRNAKCKKWAVFSDYVFKTAKNPRNPDAASGLKKNDVVSFAIVPFKDKTDFATMKRFIEKHLPCDAKDFYNGKRIPSSFAKALVEVNFFGMSFVMPQEWSIFGDKCTEETKTHIFLDAVSKAYLVWSENAESQATSHYYLQVHKALEEFLSRKTGKWTPTTRQAILVSMLAAFVQYAVMKDSGGGKVMWGTDRGAEYDWPGKLKARGEDRGLIYDIATMLAFNRLHEEGLAYATDFIYSTPNKKSQMWYDSFNRLADYLAGALVILDRSNTQVPGSKFNSVYRQCIANNDCIVTWSIRPPDPICNEITFNKE